MHLNLTVKFVDGRSSVQKSDFPTLYHIFKQHLPMKLLTLLHVHPMCEMSDVDLIISIVDSKCKYLPTYN